MVTRLSQACDKVAGTLQPCHNLLELLVNPRHLVHMKYIEMSIFGYIKK